MAVTRKQVFYLVLEILIGLTIAFFLGNWIKSQSFMNTTLGVGQLRYGNNDATILLWCYLGCLFLLMVGGFLLTKKYEESDMSLLDKMIEKTVQVGEKLKTKWRNQIKYTVEQEKKKGHNITRDEMLLKFQSDKNRMEALTLLGMTLDDVFIMIDDVIVEVSSK